MRLSNFKEYRNLEIKELEKIRDYFSEDMLYKAKIIEYKDNEYITQATKSLTYLFLIIRGKAKIYFTHENGKRTLLQFLTPGDFIGDLTIIEAEKTPKDVLSIGKTLCLAVPIKDIHQDDAPFLKKIARYIGKKLLLRMDHFSKNQSYELKYRLAEIILHIEVNGVYQEKHVEIAEYLGVSYRHYTHTLNKFMKEGYLLKQEKGYLVNHQKLGLLLKNKRN